MNTTCPIWPLTIKEGVWHSFAWFTKIDGYRCGFEGVGLA
jgi:hypothetical protein